MNLQIESGVYNTSKKGIKLECNLQNESKLIKITAAKPASALICK